MKRWEYCIIDGKELLDKKSWQKLEVKLKRDFVVVQTQLIINVLVTSFSIMVMAISFSIIFKTTKFFHFAHGAVFTSGAYAAYVVHNLAGMSLPLSFMVSTGICSVLGCFLELGVYGPLRRRNASPLVLLLASLGLYVLLQNLLSLIFGDDTKIIRGNLVSEGIKILGARITPIQIIIIIVSASLTIFTYFLLKKSILGKAIRALASDPELARVSGINTDYTMLAVFALGSALSGAAGILVALDVDLTPTMGLNALMMGVVAAIIGGIGSIPGIALGALLLGMAQHLGVWKVGSQWQDTVAFIILIFFLLLKPEGFLGRKTSGATV